LPPKLGLGNSKPEQTKPYYLESKPVALDIPAPVRQISCGANHGMCLTDDADMYTWGYGDMLQLGHGGNGEGGGDDVYVLFCK
jgi:alpha-tubulin suppressor-like RCC1 family protein